MDGDGVLVEEKVLRRRDLDVTDDAQYGLAVEDDDRRGGYVAVDGDGQRKPFAFHIFGARTDQADVRVVGGLDTLDQAIADMKLRGKNPASNVRFPAMGETSHVYLTAVEVAKLAELCDTAAGEASRRREAR